jgi:hypothetical protein
MAKYVQAAALPKFSLWFGTEKLDLLYIGYGLAVVALVFASYLAGAFGALPHDPQAMNVALINAPALTPGHPLGTDHLGRDVLARLIWGTRISLMVGISAALVAAFFGSVIGLVAGYAGGRADNIIMRGIDMLMAFPYILLALAIVAVLGPGLLNALYAIAVVNIPFFARNVRGITLGVEAIKGIMKYGPDELDPYLVLGGREPFAMADVEDAGVLATAFASRVALLVTDNLRDFQTRDCLWTDTRIVKSSSGSRQLRALRHRRSGIDVIVAHPLDVTAWLEQRLDFEPDALWEQISLKPVNRV